PPLSKRRRLRATAFCTQSPSILLAPACAAAVCINSSTLSKRRASPSASPITRSRARASNVSPGRASRAARSNSSPSSASERLLSTYTEVRESNAPITSKEGFSVVAPTKVSSPRSTKGRNASCCALLKRCTSSTKRMVRFPDVASASSARRTASLMSLTPENTAESAMNCASNASAIKRARVVLPTPGVPHRIIECGLPESKARRRGLPGPRRCSCPTNLSSDLGRRASAIGGTGAGAGNRSVIRLPSEEGLFDVADHVGALGRRESEESRIQFGIVLDRLEPEHGGLPETVDKFHDFETGRTEAHADLLEIAFLFPRQRFEPFETVLRALVREPERPHRFVISREKGGRRGTERLVEFPHRDLLEIFVIDPYPGAITDDELGIRLHVVPAKFPRPRKRERAARLLQQLEVPIEDFLLEFPPCGAGLGNELGEALEARCSRARGRAREK